MVFNDRDEIKGDFTIKARGSSSLVAKEVRAQQLAEITEFVLNPEVKQYCDIRKFVEEVFKVRDLGGEDIVYDEEKAGDIARLTQQLEQAGGQLQQLQAVLGKFKEQCCLFILLWAYLFFLLQSFLSGCPTETLLNATTKNSLNAQVYY